jgi:hypothetical protein
MANLQKILSKFNSMGAVAQPLIPDDANAQAELKQTANNNISNHAQMINESVNRLEIPELNVSQSDLYKLAGVDPKPVQRPGPANPTPNSIDQDQLDEGDLVIKRPAFNQSMHSAMDDILWKTTKNPELIPIVQKIYKMATGKDVEYNSEKDSFTIKGKGQQPSKQINQPGGDPINFDQWFKKAQADAQRKVAGNEEKQENTYKSLFKEFLQMKEGKDENK